MHAMDYYVTNNNYSILLLALSVAPSLLFGALQSVSISLSLSPFLFRSHARPYSLIQFESLCNVYARCTVYVYKYICYNIYLSVVLYLPFGFVLSFSHTFHVQVHENVQLLEVLLLPLLLLPEWFLDGGDNELNLIGLTYTT